MAYNPTLPTIYADRKSGKKRERIVKNIDLPYGSFIVEEIPMDLVWPAGDPCPNDKETLVVFIERRYT